MKIYFAFYWLYVTIEQFITILILDHMFLCPIGFTNAYITGVNALTVKILGIPIYELTKFGTEYVGNPIGIYMGAVCGICMALSVIAEELINKVRKK